MRRIACWAVSSVLLACALTACGGSSGNGVASQSAGDIVRSAISAVRGARSVLIRGNIDSNGTPVNLDLRLVPGSGGRGSVSQGGLSFKLVALGGVVYVNGSASFWQAHNFTAALVSLVAGKWLRVPATGRFLAVARLTDLGTLLSSLVSTNTTFIKSGTTTTDGQPAIGIRDSTHDGTLYVATRGKPYLLEVRATGSQPGRVTLSEFDKRITLSPPAHAILLSGQAGVG